MDATKRQSHEFQPPHEAPSPGKVEIYVMSRFAHRQSSSFVIRVSLLHP